VCVVSNAKERPRAVRTLVRWREKNSHQLLFIAVDRCPSLGFVVLLSVVERDACGKNLRHGRGKQQILTAIEHGNVSYKECFGTISDGIIEMMESSPRSTNI